MRTLPLIVTLALVSTVLPVPAAGAPVFTVTVGLPLSEGTNVLDKGDMVNVRYENAPSGATNVTILVLLDDEVLVRLEQEIRHQFNWSSASYVVNPAAEPGTYTLTAEVTADTGETASDSMVVELIDVNDPPMVSMFTPRVHDGVLRVSGFATDWDGHVPEVTLETEAGTLTVATGRHGFFEFQQAHAWEPGRHLVRVSGADDDGAMGIDEETLTIRAIYFQHTARYDSSIGLASFTVPRGVEEGRVSICWGSMCGFSPTTASSFGGVEVSMANLDGSDEFSCESRNDRLVGAEPSTTTCPFPATTAEREGTVRWITTGTGWVTILVDGVPTE